MSDKPRRFRHRWDGDSHHQTCRHCGTERKKFAGQGGWWIKLTYLSRWITGQTTMPDCENWRQDQTK